MVADPGRSIAILGAGAVGGYLGAKLTSADPNLRATLIARPAVVEAVRTRGLCVHEAAGELVARPRATASAAEAGLVDAALLTVRTYDVASAMPDLERLVADTGLVMAFQNGVGTEEDLAARFGRDRVIAATLTVSAGMEEPGVITRYSRAGGVALATMDGSPVPRWVVTMFAATGLPAAVVDDYRALRWSKLLLNMIGAATTAILDVDIGEVMADPRLFRLEQLAFREAERVMRAQGVRTVNLPGYRVPLAAALMRLPRPLAQRLLGRRIAAARSGRSPGMRADIYRGKTEVAAFNGAIVDAGSRLGIAAPVNRALTELTLEVAADPQRREVFRGEPSALLSYVELHA
jgi:2-dehydropantoate 2-reductase